MIPITEGRRATPSTPRASPILAASRKRIAVTGALLIDAAAQQLL